MNSKYEILIVGGGAAGFFTAVNIVEKNLDANGAETENICEIIAKTRQFYEKMVRIMELMSLYTLSELIDILESKKK